MKAVVTGAGGFVGGAIARALRALGYDVVGLQRGTYPELDALGVETHRVDLAEPREGWQHHLRGAHVVFHTASKVDMWGPHDAFVRANVASTANVIQACRAMGVASLVYTSSPSVIHDGQSLRGVDESYPYPQHFSASYPATKAEAERLVLDANDVGELHTCALRPHLIFGPGDTHLIPILLKKAQAGRLVQVGDGKNLSDFTFIDDCVAAHLKAAEALLLRPEAVGGKAYFISQGAPVPLWWFVNEVLRLHELPAVRRALPRTLANVLAGACEAFYRMMPGSGEPPLTRFLVSEMATDHYFSIERARTLLGYEPSVSVAEALERSFVSVSDF